MHDRLQYIVGLCNEHELIYVKLNVSCEDIFSVKPKLVYSEKCV